MSDFRSGYAWDGAGAYTLKLANSNAVFYSPKEVAANAEVS